MGNEKNQELRILTGEFRLSHPHLLKAVEVKKGSGQFQYSLEALFDKTTTKLSDLQAPVKQAAVEKWGEDQSAWPKPLKLPIRDGDKPYGKNREVKPEHKGMWVVKASSKAEYPPSVVGKNPKVAISKESEIYPGCYARASFKAHAYTFMDKDGVKFILDAVQFVRDGKAFGGKKPADQVFGTIEGGDDGEVDTFGGGAESFDGAETSAEETFL